MADYRKILADRKARREQRRRGPDTNARTGASEPVAQQRGGFGVDIAGRSGGGRNREDGADLGGLAKAGGKVGGKLLQQYLNQPNTPSFDRGQSEGAYQQQRAGERQDFSGISMPAVSAPGAFPNVQTPTMPINTPYTPDMSFSMPTSQMPVQSGSGASTGATGASTGGLNIGSLGAGIGGAAIGPAVSYLTGMLTKGMDPAQAAAIQAGGQLAGSAATGAASGAASGVGAGAGAASGLATGGLGLLAAAPVIVGSVVDQMRLKRKAEQAMKQMAEYSANAPGAFEGMSKDANLALAAAKKFAGTPEEAAALYKEIVGQLSGSQTNAQDFYTSGSNWFGQNTPNVASVPQTMGPNVYSPLLQSARLYQQAADKGGADIGTPQYTNTDLTQSLNPEFFSKEHNFDFWNQPEVQSKEAAASSTSPYAEVYKAYWNDPNFAQSFKDVYAPKYGIGSGGFAGWIPSEQSESGQAWNPGAVGQVMGGGDVTGPPSTGAIPGSDISGAGKRSPQFLTPELDNRAEAGTGKLGGQRGPQGDPGTPFGVTGKRQGGMGVGGAPQRQGGRPGGQSPFGGMTRQTMMPQQGGGVQAQRRQPNGVV